ncbi:hypothetical protein [Chlorobium limicola]|uniref:Lipoprotein n=1 Tax=Chlorobium limicola TaxID=1092 RepID=A0A101J735_CHLLI|nr:hypothetical protein [Chlorobium limicola]KUL21291.1 hypothetical protein ASB62_08205 [Chlorobium limicola]
MIKFIVSLLCFSLFILSGGCTGIRHAQQAGQSIHDSGTGISGLAPAGTNLYLAVHDVLGFEDGPRLSLVRTYPDRPPAFTVLTVDDWLDSGGRSSDLESVCVLPSRPDEFIAAESGYWKGSQGRLFHFRIDYNAGKAVVLGVSRLPFLVDNDPDHVGDQFEGLICLENSPDQVILLLGERGGSVSYPSGVIRWGVLDLRRHSLSFSEQGLHGIVVHAPGSWKNRDSKRDISDMYLHPDGSLWASACEDPGDAGPFRSLVYRLGSVRKDSEQPVLLAKKPEILLDVSGFKIEALSSPSVSAPLSTMSIGTDDEIYGGVWRSVH